MSLPTPDLQRRYEGKPLLRLLDAYVLWAIGALPEEQEAVFQQMTPKLRQTWNRAGEEWHAVVASEMHFPPTMPTLIREAWEKNQAIAAANKVTLPATSFAYMFVDANFHPDA